MKLAERYKYDSKTSTFIIKFLFAIADIGCQNENLNSILETAANSLTNNDDDSAKLSLVIFNELINAFDKFRPKNIFYFNESNKSGIELTEFEVPKNGYLFFGWISVEKFEKRMSVWNLSNESNDNFELFIWENQLIYRVNYGTNKTNSIQHVLFKDLRLNEWYFIELYQLNDKHLVCLLVK